MKKITMNFEEYQMRLLERKDADEYYKKAILESDSEAKYFTGTVNNYSKDQIISYIKAIVKKDDRYDFIISSNEEIIGEVVLSEIDHENCHYRICIFDKQYFSKGIGFKASKLAFEFAFSELGVNTIELEVFPFNVRGIALYEKMGFEKIEDILDDEADEPYREICVMRLKKENFI